MTPSSSTLSAPSYSRLSTFHNCRAKYFYRYVLGIERAAATATLDTRVHAGKAGHAALDVMYHYGYEPKQYVLNAIEDAWAGHVPSERFAYLTHEHLGAIISNYMDRYPRGEDGFETLRLRPMDVAADALVGFEGTVDADGYMLMAEQPMVVRLSNGQCITVILDLAVTRGDAHYVVDHKFTADYLGDNFKMRQDMSYQPRMYALALQTLVGSCDGAIINGIYMGAYATRDTSKATRFQRLEYDYSAGQLQETLEWITETTRQMHQFEGALEMDPAGAMSLVLQNDQAYHRNCDYLDLCSVSPEMRTRRISTLYQLKTER